MNEQMELAESSPAEVETPVAEADLSRGPLVDLTSDQRAEFRRTGNLPEPPKKAEAKSEPDTESEPAAEADEPQEQESKPKTKPKQNAQERIAQLKRTIEKIEAGAGIKPELKQEAKSELRREPVAPQPVQFTRPRPTTEDRKPDGKPAYETYEEFVEDLADWKAEQRIAAERRTQAEQQQIREVQEKAREARERYERFDEIIQPTVDRIIEDKGVYGVVKQMINESEVLPDLMFTLGSDEAELAKFISLAKNDPGKALRYIALTESLIADRLSEKPKEQAEAPVKPRTAAPRPPSEVGGRAVTPGDNLQAAAAAGDFRAFKSEANRRYLAKLKA